MFSLVKKRWRQKVPDSERPGAATWARSRQEPSEVKIVVISLVLKAKLKRATAALQPPQHYVREVVVAAVRWPFFVNADPARVRSRHQRSYYQ